MRNPNGYGTVARLSGKRRNPFIVKKTTGFDGRGYPIIDIIGYSPTREDGLMMLAKYNRDPWNIEQSKITFEQLFELWKEKKLHKLGSSNSNVLKSAYKHCRALHKMKYRAIRSYHMQECVDGCNRSYATQGQIKNLFGHLDSFAFELDVISKQYSELVSCESIPETSKKPFTEDEISKIWEYKDMPWADSVLALLYTGFRISELLNLRASDVNLIDETITGGAKTAAGKNRIIPIHSRILPLIKTLASNCNGLVFPKTTASYYPIWYDIMHKLDMDHTPHDCRHAFRSRLDSLSANKKCIDLLMGHKSKDVGERVYTHKTIKELKETIELLK